MGSEKKRERKKRVEKIIRCIVKTTTTVNLLEKDVLFYCVLPDSLSLGAWSCVKLSLDFESLAVAVLLLSLSLREHKNEYLRLTSHYTVHGI